MRSYPVFIDSICVTCLKLLPGVRVAEEMLSMVTVPLNRFGLSDDCSIRK